MGEDAQAWRQDRAVDQGGGRDAAQVHRRGHDQVVRDRQAHPWTPEQEGEW